ncbi:hypothetical protein RB195_015518 [Necator americanus]|uniref:DRBM domain-containing protein n=1 Tax=Necator americanus TaxID=51031 RepID=A0ABR1E529_NECAM
MELFTRFDVMRVSRETGSKRHEAKTVAQAAGLEATRRSAAVGIEVGPWRAAEMGGGNEDLHTTPTAALHRAASSAAACTNVRASCRALVQL